MYLGSSGGECKNEPTNPTQLEVRLYIVYLCMPNNDQSDLRADPKVCYAGGTNL